VAIVRFVGTRSRVRRCVSVLIRDTRSVALRIADMKLILDAVEAAVGDNYPVRVIAQCELLEEEVYDLKQLYKHNALY